MIYWFGHEEDVAAGEADILVMDSFPAPDDLAQLSREPLPELLTLRGPLGVCTMTTTTPTTTTTTTAADAAGLAHEDDADRC